MLAAALSVEALRGRAPAVMWLAVAAQLPTAEQLEDLRWWGPRDPVRALTPLADQVRDLSVEAVVHDLRTVTSGTLLVDVTHAMLDPWYLTGIQRVVRGLLAAIPPTDVQLVQVVEPGRVVAVTAQEYADRMTQGRGPRPAESRALRARAVRSGIALLLAARRPLAERLTADRDLAARPAVVAGRRAIRWLYRRELGITEVRRAVLVLPVDGVLLEPEVRTGPAAVDTLLALRDALLARLAIIFHDAITLTHPQYYGEAHLAGFAHYTRLVAAADVLLPVSEASAESARALSRLQAAPAVVRTVPLPVSGLEHAAAAEATTAHGPPLLLAVGSLEPRKNHVRLLRAALLLHERGVHFRLVLVAGSAWLSGRIERELASVRAAGVDVDLRQSVDDDELAGLYASARAAVFVSEVEGYGLPIVEALAHGTPVVCSDSGSMAEIAAAGGCLTVPPRDVDAIADALQRLLQDDDEHRRLRAEATSRPTRSWSDYASDVQRTLLAPPHAPSADSEETGR